MRTALLFLALLISSSPPSLAANRGRDFIFDLNSFIFAVPADAVQIRKLLEHFALYCDEGEPKSCEPIRKVLYSQASKKELARQGSSVLWSLGQFNGKANQAVSFMDWFLLQDQTLEGLPYGSYVELFGNESRILEAAAQKKLILNQRY